MGISSMNHRGRLALSIVSIIPGSRRVETAYWKKMSNISVVTGRRETRQMIDLFGFFEEAVRDNPLMVI